MELTQGYKYLNIPGAHTTTVKTGPGVLHAIIVNATDTGAISIYDNTSASGVIGALKASITEDTYLYDIEFKVGLTIVTAAGASRDITVVYY